MTDPTPVATLADRYRRMLLVRRAEERVIQQYAEQNAAFARKESPEHTIKCPTHLSIGQEAAAVGVCSTLEATDVVYSTHRCHAHYLAKGGSPRAMMAELFGRVTGCGRGKGGSMHLVDMEVGMMGASAIVGGSIPLAAGAALSFQLRKLPHVAVAFFGDGAVEQGVFHESLNVAAVKKLPVLFVCENNFYATLSHVGGRQPTPIAERAASYGVPGVRVTGDDVAPVERAARAAVARARAGHGPTLLEVEAYRWMSHVGTEPDTGKMKRSAEELGHWKDRCPVVNGRRTLLAAGMSESQVTALDRDVEGVLDEAMDFARKSPLPALDELMDHLGAGAQS